MKQNLRATIAGCILSLFMAFTVGAQNLVVNGDFEALNFCPERPANIAFAPAYNIFPSVRDWVRPSYGTPDFMHSCSIDSVMSTPVNFFGSQVPRSGNGYVGMIPYANVRYAEYISTRLSRPLCKDSTYDVRFFVNTTDGGTYTDTTKFFFHSTIVAVNEIGLHFSDTLPIQKADTAMRLPYHVMSDTNVHMTDTALWFEVRGSYKARGGERWITIGTFGRGAVPAHSMLRKGKAPDLFSYCYIDDVSVTGRGPQCAQLSVEKTGNPVLSISPNPARGKLRIGGTIDHPAIVTVTTVAGLTVLCQPLPPAAKEIDVSQLPAGMYLLQLQTAAGRQFLRFRKE